MTLFEDYGGIAGRLVGRDEFNHLPLAERDRRWARIREEMAKRGVDCLLLNGNSGRWNEMNANIRYVAGYADPLSGTCYALFPTSGDGTLVTQMTGKRSLFTLSWFEDLRVGQTGQCGFVWRYICACFGRRE